MTLLRVDGLDVTYRSGGALLGRRRTHAVRDVSLAIAPGETLGLVGESGSGKSTVGRAILHLLRPDRGTVTFSGHELTKIRGRLPAEIRRELQVVFQDPYSSLDPTKVVADLVGEPLATHFRLSRREREPQVIAALERVGLTRGHLERYPHEFSGGQRQRICLARALVTSPKLLVLDEPVSALDVSTQSQVVNLLDELQRDLGVSYLFIAHDLTVVRHVSDRIAVMYLGRIVEDGPAERVADQPAHPYSQALLASAPVADVAGQRERRLLRRRLTVSEAAEADHDSDGCPFAPRCAHAFELCRRSMPGAVPVAGGGHVRCHLYDQSSTDPQPVAALVADSAGLVGPDRA